MQRLRSDNNSLESLSKRKRRSHSVSNDSNEKKHYNFIGNGTYGCVISPPYYNKEDIINVDIEYKNKDKNDVGKLFKDYDGYLDELEEIKKVNKIDPLNKFTSKLKGAIVHKKMIIDNDEVMTCLSYYDKEDDISEIDDDFKSSKDYSLANELLKAIDTTRYLKWGEIIFENGGVAVNNMYRLSYRDCLRKFEVFLQGMKKLQEHNYVHQDIKPGNVLISPKKISLIDFGLMRQADKIYVSENLSLLSYNKYKYYPPEYAIASILMKRNVNKFSNSNISDIRAKLDAPDSGLFNEKFLIKNKKLEMKYRKGIERFFNEIKKRNIEYVSDVFDKDLALKVDVFSIAYIICSFDKHIEYKNDDEKIFINDLYERCIEPNPFQRISITELYDIVKKENNRLNLSHDFGNLPLSNFDLMNDKEETMFSFSKPKTGGFRKLKRTECNKVPLRMLFLYTNEDLKWHKPN